MKKSQQIGLIFLTVALALASGSGVGSRLEVGDDSHTMADIEREAILAALERTGGRRAEAARQLEIGLRTLQRKLKEYKEQGYYEE